MHLLNDISIFVVFFVAMIGFTEQQQSIEMLMKHASDPPEAGCQLPPPPTHGSYSSPQCQQNQNLPQCQDQGGGAIVEVPPYWLLAYSCHSGYKLPRNTQVYYSRCFNGVWAPVPPVCLDERVANFIHKASLPKPVRNMIPGECLLPTFPSNGRYFAFECSSGSTDPVCQYIPGTPVPSGFTLTYSCNPGYVKHFSSGSASPYVRCSNGSWDINPLQCIKLCPALNESGRQFRCFYGAKEVNCTNQPSKPGTIATYRCRSLWTKDPSDKAKFISCTSEGKWTYSPPPCQPVCGLSAIDNSHPRIIDGIPSPLGHFPWHAGVYHRSDKQGQKDGWDQFCGGTLIKPGVVLTAAYCVVIEGQDRRITVMNPEDLKVALGKYYRNWDREEPSQIKRNVQSVLVPGSYSGSSTNFQSDIALLQLTEDVPLSIFVMPVCLDTSKQPSKNMLGYITGWGNSEQLSPSDTVLYCSWPVQDYNTCFRNMVQKKNGFISEDKFCASVEVHEAARKSIGGSFSFVFTNQHYIHGVLSAQVVRRNEVDYLTEINYPVFTNISKQFDWISASLTDWTGKQ